MFSHTVGKRLLPEYLLSWSFYLHTYPFHLPNTVDGLHITLALSATTRNFMDCHDGPRNSFIRHKWTLYYGNAPPPRIGNLQVGQGIRKNTALLFLAPWRVLWFHRVFFFCTNRGFCYSKTSNLTWITIFKYTVWKMKCILVLIVKRGHRTNGQLSRKIDTWTYCMFNNNLNYTGNEIT